MSIISRDIIEAIGREIEPNEVEMNRFERADFLKCIESVCNKELEARQLIDKAEKIKTLEHLITVCVENDDEDTKEVLVDELLKLM